LKELPAVNLHSGYQLVTGEIMITVLPDRGRGGSWRTTKAAAEAGAKAVWSILQDAERLVTEDYPAGYLADGVQGIVCESINYGIVEMQGMEGTAAAVLAVSGEYLLNEDI